MPRQSALSLMLLLLATVSARPAQAADEGRLRATGGLVTIEGSAGGGLVPWAVLSGLSTRPGFDVVAGATTTHVGDFDLQTIGLSASWNDRVEVSLARQRFTIDGAGARDSHLQQTVLGAKLRVGGDLIYGHVPQLALGINYKIADDDALASTLGARDDRDVEAYFSVTRLILDGPGHRNWLLNGTVRATRANETGLLGFGRPGDDSYDLVGEASVAMFFNPQFALGAEYRQKPDGLAGLGESDWRDVFIAWFPSKRVRVALAWVDLGTIAAREDQDGVFVSITGNW